jgi:hypothetical protein
MDDAAAVFGSERREGEAEEVVEGDMTLIPTFAAEEKEEDDTRFPAPSPNVGERAKETEEDDEGAEL